MVGKRRYVESTEEKLRKREVEALERIAVALERKESSKYWKRTYEGIIQQPIWPTGPYTQQTFWNCERCFQVHIDMKVGDCVCDCHKVTS